MLSSLLANTRSGKGTALQRFQGFVKTISPLAFSRKLGHERYVLTMVEGQDRLETRRPHQ